MWIPGMRCLAISTSLKTNLLSVNQRTGRNTTLGFFGSCRSSLDTWLPPGCNTTSLGVSGSSFGKLSLSFIQPSFILRLQRLRLISSLYRLWGEPVNLREQHDALEFFNSLVDSLDEALKALGHPAMLSKVLGGSFADQKICQGCPHRYIRNLIL